MMNEHFSQGGGPIVVRSQVKWGDCDPAGVVYTPRFADYVVEAGLEFLERLLGAPLRETIKAHDLDVPAKAISIEFKHSLSPEQLLDITIYVGDIRQRTFDLKLFGSTVEGRSVFDATFSLICIRNGIREAKLIPDFVRQTLLEYRSHHRTPAQAASIVSGTQGLP